LSIFTRLTVTEKSVERKLDIGEGFCGEAGRTEKEEEGFAPDSACS